MFLVSNDFFNTSDNLGMGNIYNFLSHLSRKTLSKILLSICYNFIDRHKVLLTNNILLFLMYSEYNSTHILQ